MRRTTVMAVMMAGCATLATAVTPPPLGLKVTGGKAMVWNRDAGGWTTVKDSAALAYGDSVFLDHYETAAVRLGSEVTVLLKGLCRVSVQGADLDVNVILVEGQLFFRRQKPYEFNSVGVVARTCRVTPLGTACAVKFTKHGEPSVAVLAGKARIEGPNGSVALVEAGRVATFVRNNAFVTGKLTARGVASLQQWSGVAYEGPVPPQGESDVVHDIPAPQELETAPAAPAASASPASPSVPLPAPDQSSMPATGEKAGAGQAKVETEAESQVPASRVGEGGEGEESTVGEGGKVAEGEGVTGETQAPGPWKPTWEIGAGMVTVGGEQWTMLNFGVDIPIWKFGVFLDLEVFIDSRGKFSSKGWEFEPWYKDVFRKIRYVRFGREGDPFFVKLGGLHSVTMGYGFVVDRFTNMLHYPDQKLLGLQMELNDVSPIGITFQGLIADFYDFANDGGVMAARLGFRFLKSTDVPLLKHLLVSGIYAVDLNQFAPAHDWRYEGLIWDKDRSGRVDWDWAMDPTFHPGMTAADSQVVRDAVGLGLVDDSMTVYEMPDTVYRDSTERFSVVGGDAGLPIINGKVLRIDLYGQAATRMDKVSGWGFGAPGVLLTFLPARRVAWVGLEYRHVSGRFTPGYFNTYYLDERVQRNPVRIKSRCLTDVSLNGVFGQAGVTLGPVLAVSANYQYMAGESEKDQRYEALASIPDTLLKRIPKVARVEAFVCKTRVGSEPKYRPDGTTTGRYDGFFDKTPYLYWGFRLGFEITPQAVLVWENRYGYEYNAAYRPVSNNTISVTTAIRF